MLINSEDADERSAAALSLGALGLERGSAFISHRLQVEKDAGAVRAMRDGIRMIRDRKD